MTKPSCTDHVTFGALLGGLCPVYTSHCIYCSAITSHQVVNLVLTTPVLTLDHAWGYANTQRPLLDLLSRAVTLFVLISHLSSSHCTSPRSFKFGPNQTQLATRLRRIQTYSLDSKEITSREWIVSLCMKMMKESLFRGSWTWAQWRFSPAESRKSGHSLKGITCKV